MFDEILAQIQHAKRLNELHPDPLTQSAIKMLAHALPEETLDGQSAIAFKYVDKLRSAAAILYSDATFLEEPVTEQWD